MLRAMDSAVSGLRAHQNKLDVIGNNIANVNTFGFKSQSYSFKEAMYQTSTTSTKGSENAGGVNAAQYGYGSMMGSISTDMSASTPTYVGGLNASVDGEGFFITFPKSTETVTVADMKKTDFDYTRVGQFNIDGNGYLTDANGNFVYGFRPDEVDKPTRFDGDLVAIKVPSDTTSTTAILPSPKMRMAARPSYRTEIPAMTVVRSSSPPLLRLPPRWRATWKAPQQRTPALALW